jgi:hypothetical protein
MLRHGHRVAHGQALAGGGMSTATDVAVLPSVGPTRGRVLREDIAPGERSRRRLCTFAALALYGTIRWFTLLTPAPAWRMLGMLAVAVALAGLGRELGPRRWALRSLLVVLALIGVLAVAGVPTGWIVHLRFALIGKGIGEGASAMPGALVPYNGVNDWLRLVIVLGAGLLLLCAAAILALAPRPLSDAWRAAAALPLLALATVPSTLVHPQLPYVQGFLLFLLLAAFLWAERVHSTDAPIVALLLGAAVIGATIAAPRLDRHSPWLDYQRLASNLAPSHVDTFDWRQGYGPLHWPRANTEVLDVKAAAADYWKAENLDGFNGRGWVAGQASGPDPQGTVAPANLARWTQTIKVTVRAMRTHEVIAAGVAAAPSHTPGSVISGPSQGTWRTNTQLGPGDSYTVKVYAPRPSPAQLRSTGSQYPPQLLPTYLTAEIPATRNRSGAQSVFFAPFGAGGGYGPSSDPARPILAASPYARAYTLARTLATRSATPYDYVMSVQRYLASPRFRYDEDPAAATYPLETFLFTTRDGYCQQFAGAMALLLRMGGVPARVATGFTPGSFDSRSGQWVVSDLDAHAWVEAWFPSYGWVRFDPTPSVAPARGGHAALPLVKGQGSSPAARSGPAPHARKHAATARPKSIRQHGGGPSALLALLLVLVLTAIALLARLSLVLGEPDPEQRLAELQRALERSGHPIAEGTTLATLEQRFRGSPAAAAYVRRLRLARFAESRETPSRQQRRALRTELGTGLGPLGRLRALWALPPQLIVHRPVSNHASGGIHSA